MFFILLFDDNRRFDTMNDKILKINFHNYEKKKKKRTIFILTKCK